MFKFLEIAKAFVIESQDDLETASDILAKKRYSKVVFHCQGCIEKIIKAALIFKNIISSEHKVVDIFVKEFGKEIKNIERIDEAARFLERQGIKSRYPLFSRKDVSVWIPKQAYNEKDATESLKKAEFVFNTLLNFLKANYNLVL